MSTSNYYNVDALRTHSVHLPAGLKKSVKQGLARSRRRESKADLAGEVSSLQAATLEQSRALILHEASQASLDEYADWLLTDSFRSDDSADDLVEEPELSQDGESLEIPLYLQGSLPDWMLNQLEAANGDAFDTLSLFEAKCPSPRARISMEDEVMYA